MLSSQSNEKDDDQQLFNNAFSLRSISKLPWATTAKYCTLPWYFIDVAKEVITRTSMSETWKLPKDFMTCRLT